MRKTVQIASKLKKEYPNLKLSQESIPLLEDYLELLLTWNRKINLTAIREKNAMIVKHLFDSLAALTVGPIVKRNLLSTGNIMDFGSGAGIPGIILAICEPGLHLVSVDKSKKKIAFQNQVVRQLGLSNVRPVQQRLQELVEIPAHKSAYDIIISRAFDQIKNILYFGERLLKPNGYFLLWKGEKWQEEMEDVEKSVLSRFQLLASHRYQFQDYHHGGVILLIQKRDSMEKDS